MNQLGVHALVWAGDLHRASIEKAVKNTRAAGFDLLELSLHDTTTLDIAHARETLAAHVGENHRGYLGAGSIDFTAFFHALRRISYRGAITFENFSSEVVMPSLSSDLAIWRNLWTDGMALAAQANGFLKAQLTASRHA